MTLIGSALSAASCSTTGYCARRLIGVHGRAEFNKNLCKPAGRGTRVRRGYERQFRVGNTRETIGRFEHAMIG